VHSERLEPRRWIGQKLAVQTVLIEHSCRGLRILDAIVTTWLRIEGQFSDQLLFCIQQNDGYRFFVRDPGSERNAVLGQFGSLRISSMFHLIIVSANKLVLVLVLERSDGVME